MRRKSEPGKPPAEQVIKDTVAAVEQIVALMAFQDVVAGETLQHVVGGPACCAERVGS